jgi:hypothetical protein
MSMSANGSHTLEDRERTALVLLASAMFGEAQELAPESALARCLGAYVAQLLQPGSGRAPSRAREPYRIESFTDPPVFRRLATSMDALALALGPWSGVGRALSAWAERINLAVAEAERRRVTIDGPARDLLAMAAALGITDDDPVVERLIATHPQLLEQAGPAEAPPAESERPLRTGRLWTRNDDRDDRRSRRRRRRI